MRDVETNVRRPVTNFNNTLIATSVFSNFVVQRCPRGAYEHGRRTGYMMTEKLRFGAYERKAASSETSGLYSVPSM